MRARQLHETADHQLAELAEILSRAGQAGLERPCAGRERLGDGTVGAVAAHAIDNYGRIAQFVADVRDGTARHEPAPHGQAHGATDVELNSLLGHLESARVALAGIEGLTDAQLDSVPPAGAMRFADGERTLEQVIANLLNHQRHQIEAVTAALRTQ
jgi:hypothetical protein